MDDRDVYRQLVAWLKDRHPLVYAQWESERKRLEGQDRDSGRLLQAPGARSGSALDQLSADSSIATITNAIREELEALGISGGTPGITADGAPCIHLMKKGLLGQAYEEDVTLARIRDSGYRRHLRQVFG